MKNSIRILGFALAAAVSTNIYAESDLIGTAIPSNSGMELVVDFANDSNALGLQYDIKLSGGMNSKRADLTNCLSGLGQEFSASTCTAIDEETIRVMIFSMSSAPIPTGTIGSISVGGSKGDRRMRASAVESATASYSNASVDFSNVVIGGQGGVRIEPGLVDFSVGSKDFR